MTGRFDEAMRAVERSAAKLTGSRAKARAFRKRVETKIRQVAAKAEPVVIENLIKSGRAGWANDPDTPGGAVLVERGTGCVLLGPQGKVIRRKQPVVHPVTPAIDQGRFIQHLRTPGIELYVPYMYLDRKGYVTVGIGHLLETAEDAKKLRFFERGTNKPAHPQHVENAFNKVKNSGLTGSEYHVFKPLTSIEVSEADAVNQAMKHLEVFLNELKRQSFFREFDTFPVAAKMGLLDMIYTLGLTKLLGKFKIFNPAVRRRDWKMAALESDRGGDVSQERNQIVRQWFEEAARLEPFFINVICTKRIDARF